MRSVGWFSDFSEGKMLKTTNNRQGDCKWILDSSVSPFNGQQELQNNRGLELICVILYLMRFE